MEPTTTITNLLPTFDQLFAIAPIATITLLVAAVGWFAASYSSKRTIDIMKEFIEFLKGRDK